MELNSKLLFECDVSSDKSIETMYQNLSKDWKYEYGGCLTVFNEENPVVILPEYNSLVLLYLGEDGVDHYISEVSKLAPGPRMAVSGWFSRPQNSS